MSIAEPPIPYRVSPHRSLAALAVRRIDAGCAWYKCQLSCTIWHEANKTRGANTYTTHGTCTDNSRFKGVLARLDTSDILRPMLVVIEAEGRNDNS